MIYLYIYLIVAVIIALHATYHNWKAGMYKPNYSGKFSVKMEHQAMAFTSVTWPVLLVVCFVFALHQLWEWMLGEK